MDHTPESAPDELLTVSEIAARAGVRPSAVSNWRRRHAGPGGFPPPVDRSPAGLDRFSLAAVRDWAERNGRTLSAPAPGVDLWREVQDLASHRSMDEAVQIALSLLALADSKAEPGLDPGPELAGLDARVGALATPAARAEAAEYVLAARRRSLRQGADFETDPEIARLLVDLAEPLGGLVLDTCAGLAGLLCEAGSRLPASAPVALAGVELDEWAVDVANLRLSLHGIARTVGRTDALRDPALPGSADIVICDVPKGQRLAACDVDPADPRWVVGHPGTSGDMAWLQHAVACCTPGGRAVVLAPQATLHRGGRAGDIRAELLRRGMVRAVIALPAGSAGRTARVPMAIWLLVPPRAGEGSAQQAPPPVLLVDAVRAPEVGPGGAVSDALRARIVDVVRAAGGGRGVERPGFARTVPVLSLLEHDAPLTPARWVEPATVPNPGAALGVSLTTLRSAHRRIAERTPPAPAVGSQDPAATGGGVVTLAELADEGRVVILRGVRIAEAALVADGLPVAGAGELRGHAPAGRVDPGSVERTPITAAGDVLVLPGPSPAVRVEGRGGRVLAWPLVAVRPLVAEVPSAVLAAALERALGALPERPGATLRPQEVALRLPPPASAAAADAALGELEALRRDALALLDALDAARAATLDAASTGRLAPRGD